MLIFHFIFLLSTASVYVYFYLFLDRIAKAPPSQPIPSFKSFKPVFMCLLALVTGVSLIDVWVSSPYLLKVYKVGAGAYLSGYLLMLTGLCLFIAARLRLGKNYSPCYESQLPQAVETTGLYRFIRHPIYTANITLLIGLFIATGSVWILCSNVVIAVYYFRSAKIEERYLKRTFPEYEAYSHRSSMFFPAIFSLFR